MLNSELNLLPTSFSKEFREFDAHVYYDSITRPEALNLREKSLLSFHGKAIFIGRMVDHPIGPHPVPMFEINFKKEWLEAITEWFSLHRGGLTVLVHEVTGNDERDHTVGAKWLGKPLKLDASKFDPVIPDLNS